MPRSAATRPTPDPRTYNLYGGAMLRTDGDHYEWTGYEIESEATMRERASTIPLARSRGGIREPVRERVHVSLWRCAWPRLYRREILISTATFRAAAYLGEADGSLSPCFSSASALGPSCLTETTCPVVSSTCTSSIPDLFGTLISNE